MNNITPYLKLMRLHRPIGIFLLLWPALWALWLAGNGHPTWSIVGIFVLGATITRAAGCVINDFFDRDFDGHVARTRDRPLVTGQITPHAALRLLAGLGLLALLLVLQLNWLTIQLSCIGALLATIYPLMKRYTHWPQLVLGLAYGWAVPMAFAAQTGQVPAAAWLLYAITICWSIAYDTMYAMVDREDDRKIDVKSTALLFGNYDKIWIGLFQGLVLGLWVLLAYWQQLGDGVYVGLLVAAGLTVYQQWLLKDRLPAACFKAFLNNNWLGLVIFIGLVVSYW